MNSHGKPMIKLLAVIVDRDKTKAVTEIFRTMHVHFCIALLAQGTANSEIMDFLGLGSVDKSMVLCLEPDFKANYILKTLHEKLKLDHPGKGIAFTLPLSGVCAPVLHLADEDIRNRIQNEVEKRVESISKEVKHDLIVVIAHEGYVSDVMDAAKSAGATGGTVLLARRVGVEEAVKFFGIELQAEKEVTCMLVSREKKREIMHAVNLACGIRTEARGMIFSLPVDSIVGLNLEGQAQE